MMKLCKIIRIITVAPLAAALAVTLLFLHGGFFANGANFAAAIISLTVFPLLAYPVSLIKKGDERRRFQRSLAIVLAVAGYIGGLLFSLAANAADGERVLYLTYLLSGVAIAFSSFVLKKKSSGHACGIAGPVALLAYYVHPLYLLGLLLLLPVGYASLKMKRHTLPQLISGAVIPIVCLILSAAICYFRDFPTKVFAPAHHSRLRLRRIGSAQYIIGCGFIQIRKRRYITDRYLTLAGFIGTVDPLVDSQICGNLFLNEIIVFTQILKSRIIHIHSPQNSVYVLSKDSIDFTIVL